MANPLYYVIDLIFSIILVMILHHNGTKAQGKHEKSFRILVQWVLFFCLQDAFWGVCASTVSWGNLPLFCASTVFHLSTVTTTFFWLYYILDYLSTQSKIVKVLLYLDGFVIMFQALILVWNLFEPVVFHIEDGIYVTDFMRTVAFLNQYVVYLLMSVASGFAMQTDITSRRKKYLSVFTFTLAPVLSGAFQYIYPEGPFYSMGYFLGIIIIYMYVIDDEREEFRQKQTDIVVKEQELISNTDAMTGLWNRRSYDQDIRLIDIAKDNSGLTYLSFDINGLKEVNDTLGHNAGDELIIGAANCLKKSLSNFGQIYRIGGDEFAAIIHVSKNSLKGILQNLEDTIAGWYGNEVDRLNLSCGIVSVEELQNPSITSLAKIADERMYASKEEFYSRKGIDRHGLQTAFASLCASYTKILEINLTTDTYKIIRMDDVEQKSEKGFSQSITQWLHDFGTSGQVHPDSLDDYLKRTSRDFIISYFDSDKSSLNIFYKRKDARTLNFRMCKMEMIRTAEYSTNNRSLFLYVKDIDI